MLSSIITFSCAMSACVRVCVRVRNYVIMIIPATSQNNVPCYLSMRNSIFASKLSIFICILLAGSYNTCAHTKKLKSLKFMCNLHFTSRVMIKNEVLKRYSLQIAVKMLRDGGKGQKGINWW